MPYHVALDAVDGASVGKRDNQMAANAIPGTIVIVKDAIPNGTTDFEFSLEGQTNFFLDDDGTNLNPLSDRKSFTVDEGDYDAAEIAPPSGWTLTNLNCVDPDNQTNGSINLAARTVTIDVDPAETVTCTFTNTQTASITITKNTVPDGEEDFDFTDDIGRRASSAPSMTTPTRTCPTRSPATT